MKPVKTLAICIFLLLSSGVRGEEAVKPVVISLSAVGDYTGSWHSQGVGEGWPRRWQDKVGFTLRPEIIAGLVRNYNCVVLSRSACNALVTEGCIYQLKAIASGGSEDKMVLAADYALRIHVRNGKAKDEVSVFLVSQDLRENVDKEPIRLVWNLKTEYTPQAEGNAKERDYCSIVESVISD